MTIYTVQPGDTVYSISARFGIPVDRIILDNQITPDQLSVGQALMLVYHSAVHTVQEGETIWSIAASHGITVNEIWRNNPILGGKTTIYPGQTLVISFVDAKQGELETTGYVYTFVDHDVLRKTLPYLTYLAVFSYGIREDGSLVIPEGDDELIALAHEYGAKAMLVLTSLGDDGRFSSERVSVVLNDENVMNTLVENVAEIMLEKGYDAINSDFEYIFAADRDRYTEFIRRLTEVLHPLGKIVDVSLPPKTSDDQVGLLYEGIDYRALGEIADTVLLMTYEWGYTYSSPRAIAPIPFVQTVVDYALTAIPQEKINMGMPNYAYDWQLPWVEGVPARSMSNMAAVELANESGAVIQFDEVAQTPFFRYFDDTGVEHEVWFEDARSVRAKLALASGEDLNGIGVWNVTRWFPQLWFVLNVLYNIRRG